MHSAQSDDAGVPALDSEAGRSLVERLKGSQDLNRSPRLRQLFEYLYAQSITDSAAPLTEEQIGVEVFGRKRGYDTGSDTIVRVQVSQLRRKLEHYFLSEGAAEPLIIELPKRSYVTVFRLRGPNATDPSNNQAAVVTGFWSRGRIWSLALLLSGLAIAGIFSLKGRTTATPYRDHFWSRLLRNGRPAVLVTSDANAMVLCDYLGRTITPAEYAGSGYPTALLDAEVADPAIRRLLRSISSNFVTNMPDLRVAAQVSQLAASMDGRLNVVYARDFRYHPQTPDNLILLSHRKANPWVTFFEERLNFAYEFDAKTNSAALVNLRPQSGEEPRYAVNWGVQTYAIIAHLRKSVGEGTVLLLGGADATGAEAGGNLLMDEVRVRRLYERLGISLSGAIPEFEVVLRAKLHRGFVRDYEIVTHRFLPDKNPVPGLARRP
jgi:hypothetical protein